MSQKSIFVGIPIYGGVDPNFFKCAMAMCAEFSQNLSIMPWHGDSLVCRARNALTARFLKSDCTHLLFIDSDLLFSNDHINRIASRNEDIVAGFYPKKQEGEACWVWNPTIPGSTPREDGLVQARYMGTGFMMISRHVLETMISKFGDDISYIPDQGNSDMEWDFWSVGVYRYADGTRRYLSEDWYFCQRALDLGFKVWGDTTIALKHAGAAIFPLSYQHKDFFVQQEKMPEHLEFTGDMQAHAREIFAGEYDCQCHTEPKTILDIGANQGAFSAWARVRWPNASIVTFEPVESNMGLCRKNVPDAVHFPLAVTSDGRSLSLRAPFDNSGGWSVYDLGEQTEKTEHAESLRAGDISPYDFVKVDTEGCEMEILSNLNLSETQSVACEWHRREDRRAITNLLIGQGFNIVKDTIKKENRGVLCFSRSKPSSTVKNLDTLQTQKLFSVT